MKEKLKISAPVIGKVALLVALVFIIVQAFFGYGIFDRSGWKEDKDGALRYTDQRGKALSGWQEIEGMTYYFCPEQEGAMATGWLELEGGRYFFTQEGQSSVGWTQIDGTEYYFDGKGLLQTGLVTVDGARYLTDDNGVPMKGWQQTEGVVCYCDKRGLLHTGWLELEGERYYFDATGALQTGWVETDSGLYWLADDGSAPTGWVETDLGLCRMDAVSGVHTGWLTEGEVTYYCTEEGLRHIGWLELEGETFYFHPDGVMAIGRVEIDGEIHYFTSVGKHFLLVNPWNYVPDGYTVELAEFGEYKVAAQCLQPLTELRDAVVGAGMTFNLTSAYRTHEYQTSIFMKKVNKLMGQGYSYSSAYSETSRSIAIPGTSEHQLGLAVDVKSGSRVYDWLAEHSWEYGFIVRYPDGDTALTGIYYEPWHLRYVGVELAQELYELDICVETYMNMLTKQAEAVRSGQ